MSYTKKLVGSEEERAVSPVIGVILMVAITVILAAVIAAFVMDLGDTSASASATFDVSQEENNAGDELSSVEVTITNIDRLDGVRFAGVGSCAYTGTPNYDGNDFNEVGATVDIMDDTARHMGDSANTLGGDDDCGADAEIQIIGIYEGEDTVIQTFSLQETTAAGGP